MSAPIHKRHNVSVLLYHLVCPAKYRRVVVSPTVDQVWRDVCLEIAQRYDVVFLEIGTAGDSVHFLVQSVPGYSPTKIVRLIKSVTAREILRRCPEVKQQLWGGEFWSDGYYVATVGEHGTESTIRDYVRQQGTARDYQRLYHQQLALW